MFNENQPSINYLHHVGDITVLKVIIDQLQRTTFRWYGIYFVRFLAMPKESGLVASFVAVNDTKYQPLTKYN